VNQRPRFAPFLTFAALLAVADQLTKYVVTSNFLFNESRIIIPSLLSITHFRNRGGAFSLLSWLPLGWGRMFFITATLGALVFIYYLFRSNELDSRRGRVSLTLIAGGGLGNLIDRLVHGEVIDFILFYHQDYYWPAFNLADSCITVGVALLALEIIRNPYGEPPDEAPGKEPGGEPEGE
jgi:signal peptidase II